MTGQTAWERWELANLHVDKTKRVAANTPPNVSTADHAEIERICAEAQQDGYEAGYHAGLQTGKQAGYAEGQKAAHAEAMRIGQVADRLQTALAEFDQQVADELVALAVEIARQVVRREIITGTEQIFTVVNEALTFLPHQNAAIYLNPADAALVRSHLGEALAHAGHRIFEEPRLDVGDCLLEAGGSQIDATVATRWRRVIENLGIVSEWKDRD